MANDTEPKIFCIGLSRTGTTSLHLALVALGITSSHYPGAAAWDWLNGDTSAATTRRYRAYSDLPVAAFYKALYRSHPDAKFILTVRHPDAWVRSTGRFLQARRPPSQLTILRDYFRLAVYGRMVFEAEDFRDRFLRHNAEAAEFFADKADQFLRIDIDEGFDWAPLCRFLGEPAPAFSFPHATSPYLGELMHVDRSTIAGKSATVRRGL